MLTSLPRLSPTSPPTPSASSDELSDLIAGAACFRADPARAAERWALAAASADPIVAMCARALARNLDPGAAGANPYASPPAGGDAQIALFAALDAIGFMVASRRIANAALAGVPAGTTLIDLGIGRGAQTAALLAEPGPIARVIGVDLDGASLDVAGCAIAARGIDFVPIEARFDALDWDAIAAACAGGPVAINAAFALHHMDLACKRAVLARIRALAPRVVTIVEPSSAHGGANLLRRVLAVYVHFTGVARVLRAAALAPAHRAALLSFVGRELDDILLDGPARFERHEEWLDWYTLLIEAGLTPRPVPAPLLPRDVRATERLPGAVDLWFEDFHQIAVFVFGA